MKLLICTQAVDSTDSNLGFFTRWITEFAKHCEHVEVICLRAGAYELPTNVRVHALGAGNRITRALRFWKLILQLRGEYDAVFVHMNPEYLVLGGPLWRAWGNRVGLWYAHQSVTGKLRIGVLFANRVFTVSRDSFGIDTPKKRVVGHGIDTERFEAGPRGARGPALPLRLLTVGRISESKHLLEMLPVLDELHARGRSFTFTIVGAPITALDQAYAERLRGEIQKRPYRESVTLRGALAHGDLPAVLADADVFLNFGMTGNMDKAGLEALASGLPLVTTNPTFRALGVHEGLYVEPYEPKRLADAIAAAGAADTALLMALVRRDHSLAALIPRILAQLARPA